MFNLLIWLLFKKQNMKIVALGHIDAESLHSFYFILLHKTITKLLN